jgi:dienelactone hydrolase
MAAARIEAGGAGGWTGRGELRCPDGADAVPAVLLLHVEPGQASEVETLARLIEDEGLAALVLERPEKVLELSDRDALRTVERALEALARDERIDGARLGVVGLGRAGTLAFLAGCTSRRVAAVVDAGGSLERGELSARHPIEPLELALNLGAPVLVLFAEEDPATSPEQARRIQVALERAGRAIEVERASGCGARFLDPTAPGYHAEPARAVRERIVRFLVASLTHD